MLLDIGFTRNAFNEGITVYCSWLKNDILASWQYSWFQTWFTFHIGAFVFKTGLHWNIKFWIFSGKAAHSLLFSEVQSGCPTLDKLKKRKKKILQFCLLKQNISRKKKVLKIFSSKSFALNLCSFKFYLCSRKQSDKMWTDKLTKCEQNPFTTIHSVSTHY